MLNTTVKITRYGESNQHPYLQGIDSITMERKRINRDKTVYEESFNRFAKLKEEARIARQQAAGDIQVISRAIVAKALPKTNSTIVVAVSGMVGLVIAYFQCWAF